MEQEHRVPVASPRPVRKKGRRASFSRELWGKLEKRIPPKKTPAKWLREIALRTAKDKALSQAAADATVPAAGAKDREVKVRFSDAEWALVEAELARVNADFGPWLIAAMLALPVQKIPAKCRNRRHKTCVRREDYCQFDLAYMTTLFRGILEELRERKTDPLVVDEIYAVFGVLYAHFAALVPGVTRHGDHPDTNTPHQETVESSASQAEDESTAPSRGET